LRQALAESADAPKFIETVPRRGYVFVAPVEVVGPEPVSNTIESPEETKALQAAPTPPSRLPAIRYGLAGGGAAALILLVAGILASSRTHEADSDSHWANLHAHSLTQSGQVQEAAISPDSRLVAYSTGNEFGRTLRILNLQTGTDRELAGGSLEYGSLAFSADSLRIFFVQQAHGKPPELYAMPVSGGAPTPIAASVVSPPSFSPGGKSIVFVRNEPEKGDNSVIAADADGGNERVIACYKLPLLIDAVVWSPHGGIIFAGTPKTFFHWNLIAQPAQAGAQSEIMTRQGFYRIPSLALADGGASILFEGEETASMRHQLWRLTDPGWHLQRLTHDLDFYGGVSAAVDSRSLVSVRTKAFRISLSLHRGRPGTRSLSVL